MSYVDELKHLIEVALDQTDQNLDWVEINGPIVIDRLLKNYLDTVPAMAPIVNPIAYQAKEELTKAVAAGRLGVALMRAEIQFIGSPDNLRAAADGIDNKLIKRARSLADNLVLGRIPSALPSNYDDGVASESYRAAIDGRDLAVRDIDTYAAPVSQTLRDLATGIEDYYRSLRDLALALAGLVISIVVTVVGFATVLLAVVGCIGIVISLIGLVSSIVDLTMSVSSTRDSAIKSFEAVIPAWPAVLS